MTKKNNWTLGQFENQRANIKHLLTQDNINGALDEANNLLNSCLKAGCDAFEGADFCIALAYLKIGAILRLANKPELALDNLRKAQQKFQLLADAGDSDAKKNLCVTLKEQAGCLQLLGRLDAAAKLYKEDYVLSTVAAGEEGDYKSFAIYHKDLGDLHFNQKNYPEALKAYQTALRFFALVPDDKALAITHHCMGIVYRFTEQYDLAEIELNSALKINAELDEQGNIADNLGEMASLYIVQGRLLEEAVSFCCRAISFYELKENKNFEAIARVILASAYIKLEQYDEARKQFFKAIDCKKSFGHEAQLWKTWNALYEMEKSCGQLQAAHTAKIQAIKAYALYRCGGGNNVDNPNYSKMCGYVFSKLNQEKKGFFSAIVHRNHISEHIAKLIQELQASQRQSALPESSVFLIQKLIDIAQGQRNPDIIVDDDRLLYTDAAELLCLLFQFGDCSLSRQWKGNFTR